MRNPMQLPREMVSSPHSSAIRFRVTAWGRLGCPMFGPEHPDILIIEFSLLVARILDEVAALHVAHGTTLTSRVEFFKDISIHFLRKFKNPFPEIERGEAPILIGPFKGLHGPLLHPEFVAFLTLNLFISLLPHFFQFGVIKVRNTLGPLDDKGFRFLIHDRAHPGPSPCPASLGHDG